MRTKKKTRVILLVIMFIILIVYLALWFHNSEEEDNEADNEQSDEIPPSRRLIFENNQEPLDDIIQLQSFHPKNVATLDAEWVEVMRHGEIVKIEPFSNGLSEKFKAYYSTGHMVMLKLVESPHWWNMFWPFHSHDIFSLKEGEEFSRSDRKYQGWAELAGYYLDRAFGFNLKPPITGRKLPYMMLNPNPPFIQSIVQMITKKEVGVSIHAWVTQLRTAAPPTSAMRYLLRHSPSTLTPTRLGSYLDISDSLLFDFLVDDHDKKHEFNWKATNEVGFHWDSGLGWVHGPWGRNKPPSLLQGQWSANHTLSSAWKTSNHPTSSSSSPSSSMVNTEILYEWITYSKGTNCLDILCGTTKWRETNQNWVENSMFADHLRLFYPRYSSSSSSSPPCQRISVFRKETVEKLRRMGPLATSQEEKLSYKWANAMAEDPLFPIVHLGEYFEGPGTKAWRLKRHFDLRSYIIGLDHRIDVLLEYIRLLEEVYGTESTLVSSRELDIWLNS